MKTVTTNVHSRFLNSRRCNSRQQDNVKSAENAPVGEPPAEAGRPSGGEGQEARPTGHGFHLCIYRSPWGTRGGSAHTELPRPAGAPGPALAGWTPRSKHGVVTAGRRSAPNSDGTGSCRTKIIMPGAPGGSVG